MAQYILLIYGPTEGGPSPEEMEAEMPRWYEYTQALQDAGVMRGGEALQWVETATTVRVRNGERLVSDGPFAETKEALGGYYVIDVADLDAALSWAERMPNIGYGSVEVRPVMVFDDMPSEAAQQGAQA
jgi:hypothetical protein